MEESLDRVLAGLLLKQGTTGAMVVDRNGLALALKGPAANERAAGAAKVRMMGKNALVANKGASSVRV